MPLADHKPGATNAGPPCSIGELIATLDDTDRAELQEWLANAAYRHTAIVASLRAAGHVVSRQMVSWHRRGECKCRPAELIR